ncbi:hypothetical protein [Azospirillum thiophilum]|uniref:hypothetical protein n=1 Tax=Azospirillum thiophilum TaxID=528244 RepID=UPI000698BA31|nr:hypothetical protein [Azospirillum thiophilum]
MTNDFRLAVAWLLACQKRKGPFPVMVVNGEQGAAKSTFCRVLRRLVDPNAADLRSPPKDERDALIAARNGWVLGYDNLSYVDGEQSDWFCRIATGGGFATRALYTNNEEVLIDVCRPVVAERHSVAGVSPRSGRPRRCSDPARHDGGSRRRKPAFWSEFDAARARILGALFDGVSMALRNRAMVTLPRLPRMADFALWSAAGFPAFGWKPVQFVDAYETNRARGIEEVIEADPLAMAVLDIAAERSSYIVTATALLAEINLKVYAQTYHATRHGAKNAPKSVSRLRRLAPALRSKVSKSNSTSMSGAVTTRNARSVSAVCQRGRKPHSSGDANGRLPSQEHRGKSMC